jgi:colanic acid biosynthesis glycosyl transferase WcaI
MTAVTTRVATEGVAQQARSALIFGMNYAPEPTSPALNNVGVAEGLRRRGWRVSVVAGMPHYPDWRLKPAARREVQPGVEVIRRPLYVPRKQSVLRRAAYEASWTLAATPLLAPRRAPSLVVGIVPTLGGGVLAAMAARRYGVPYVLLVQDLMGRAAMQSGIDGASRVGPFLRLAEAELAKGAVAVGVCAEAFRSYYEAAGVDPTRIFRFRNPVRLGPVTEQRDRVRARLGWSPEETVVLHSGNMGYKQGLENVLYAARLAQDDPGLRFVLQGDGSQRPSLEQLAAELRLRNVSFLPLAPEADFPNIVGAADMLLLNQRASVRNMSLPTKLGCYFASGVPVVAAVAGDDETASEVAAARAGVRVDPEDPQALLAALRELAQHPARRRRFGANGKRFAAEQLSEEGTVGALAARLEFISGIPSANVS